MEIDLLIDNANVVTVDRARPRASAIAINGGRILAIGDAADLSGVRTRRRLDLSGATVVPAFNDAHNHMRSYGEALDQVPLASPPVRCIEDILDALARRARELPSGAWLIGQGYDQNKLREGRHPTRQELDRAAPDHLVLLKHTSGHFCVVNTRAMRAARIGEVEVPEGGVVAVDDSGAPNGLLEERAMGLVRRLLRPLPVAEMARQIGLASQRYLAEGVASCQEAGIGCVMGEGNPLELAAYQRARRDGNLGVRVTLMVGVENLHPVAHHADDPDGDTLDLGLHTGFGDDWLRIGPIKIFADGSLIGRTAAMSADFEGEQGNRGYLLMEEAELRRRVLRAHRAGWQIATHAIGDRAVSAVLDAYAAALAEVPRADHRHRIEHCGVCRDEDVARIAALGVVPVPQARFISEIGDGMREALGERRTGWCYRQRSFLDAGIRLPGSSDRPVVRGSPLLGIHDLVNQRTGRGEPFNPHEALTAEQALRAYTLGSAEAAFDEAVKGSIAPGKLADLTILDQDITTMDPQGIAETRVLATVVDGRVAHDAVGLV